MKNSFHTKAVTVGLFILIGLLIFSAGLIALGGMPNIFGKTIVVQSDFTNVGGLKNGSNVLFNGVKVGVVKHITLSPNGKVRVALAIDTDKKSFIPKDATARLGNDGLVGSKILTIDGGNISNGAITNGTLLKNQAGTSLTDLFSKLQDNSNNLTEITTSLKQIVLRILDGEGSIGRLINDPSLANSMQELVNKLGQSADKAKLITENVAGYTEKLEKPGTLTYNLLHDTLLFNRLHSTFTQLDLAAQKARVVVNKLDAGTDLLQDKNKPAGMLLNDEKTAAELKTILNQLQSGTEKLNETLDALRYNFLLRGGFKKLEKEKENK